MGNPALETQVVGVLSSFSMLHFDPVIKPGNCYTFIIFFLGKTSATFCKEPKDVSGEMRPTK